MVSAMISWPKHAALVVGALACLSAAPAQAAHPNALWRVVHGLCLRDMRLRGRPAPCLAVDLSRGVAVVPDPQRATQVLLVPTARLPGIESPLLLRDGRPNYWQAAWEARWFVQRRAGRPLPRDLVAMAINSARSRSQNQLHIHVDCVRPEVRAALVARDAQIGPAWRTFPVVLRDQVWKVRKLRGAELGRRDPFRLLASGDPAARRGMGLYALAVVGATFPDGSPGFYLLSTSRGQAFGEVLLDHRCAVLRPG